MNKCKSFYIELKKAYGCTKKDSVIEVAGWKCCFKKKKSSTFVEEALPKFDKEKSDYRWYVMMRIFYTMLFLSNFVVQSFNLSVQSKYIKETDD